MSNSTPISYLILKTPEEFSEKPTVIQQDENTVLETIVQKYKIDQDIGSAGSQIWNDIAREFMSVVNVQINGEDLRKRWQNIKNIQTNQEKVKHLEASIAQELGTSQQFQIQQTEVGDKTETIVLLDSVVDDSSSKSNYNNDLVSLALTESGIQEGGTSNIQDEDLDFLQLADEILAAEQGDPAYAKKKLKCDRKFRVEESNFETRKKDIEVQIETYKRDYNDMQIEICSLETLVKSKTQKLDELRKEIKSHKT